MKKLKKINDTQWYYDIDDAGIYYVYYDQILKNSEGEDEDFTELTGQIVPYSMSDYRYTHGGSEYREAVQEVWRMKPDYVTV